jgi:hypothetical protein
LESWRESAVDFFRDAILRFLQLSPWHSTSNVKHHAHREEFAYEKV